MNDKIAIEIQNEDTLDFVKQAFPELGNISLGDVYGHFFVFDHGVSQLFPPSYVEENFDHIEYGYGITLKRLVAKKADEVVSRFYTMDPETEDLVPRGELLRNRMVVLIEDDGVRGNPESDNADDVYEQARIREHNRWCTVSDVQVNRQSGGHHLVSFIGTYSDGTKKKRTFSVQYAWYVKKNSL